MNHAMNLYSNSAHRAVTADATFPTPSAPRSRQPTNKKMLAKPIRVLVVDDHAVVRQGLCALLSAHHFTIAGEARNGREAVELARAVRPDVVLMDIAMPVLNGVEATREIIAANPAAKVLVLSAYSEGAYVDRLIEAGAAGFLEKESSAESLVAAVCEVAEGNTFFSLPKARHHNRDLSLGRDGQPKPNANRLTTREIEVLQLVGEGSANKQVAAALAISIKTVEKHRQHLMDKLNIHNTAGLTRYAIISGVIVNNPDAELALGD